LTYEESGDGLLASLSYQRQKISSSTETAINGRREIPLDGETCP